MEKNSDLFLHPQLPQVKASVWFVQHMGRQCGPYLMSTVRMMIIEGNLQATAKVWTSELGAWQVAYSVFELRQYFSEAVRLEKANSGKRAAFDAKIENSLGSKAKISEATADFIRKVSGSKIKLSSVGAEAFPVFKENNFKSNFYNPEKKSHRNFRLVQAVFFSILLGLGFVFYFNFQSNGNRLPDVPDVVSVPPVADFPSVRPPATKKIVQEKIKKFDPDKIY